MIFAFGTSSPVASVAVLTVTGEVAWEGAQPAAHRASEACLDLLARAQEALGVSLDDATLFAADLGPGSFTGVRVGIVLAKTFGYLKGVPCAGADSFDLIAPDRTVVLPSKRGEFFVRLPGQAPVRTSELPEGDFAGFGYGGEDRYPQAAGFARLLDRLTPVEPERLVPDYRIEPSISVPKKLSGGAPRA